MKGSSKLQSLSSQTENGDAQLEQPASKEVREFQDLASARPRGIIGEFVEFLWSEKRWWLTPNAARFIDSECFFQICLV